ncbi:AAA family ATPase [Tolypothrix campylonemoides VB511288]|nr:AAA family ATPase [Tolypothrix campylonemoides VB511288]
MNQEKFDQVFEDLSAQRRKVLLRFLAGEKDLAIAASLFIEESTVRKHIQEICDAFKCEPDESRSKRPDLIALFRKYKPELVPEGNFAITSEVDVGKTAEVEESSHLVNGLPPKQQDGKEQCQRGVFIPDKRCRTVWGRDNLIETVLYRLTDSQQPSILSLCGPAGYGKTEAASEVARAALQRNLFADVLWVIARQTELVNDHISQKSQLEALNWNQFLNQIAHQLHCPVERVQQRLREEKRLIVLDNAETSDVEDILANIVKMLNPSRVLLTSRLKTKAQYVGLIPIQGLEEQSSYRLLHDEAIYNNIPALIQASDEQLHRVHELSCGAPLALHFIVGRVWDDQALEPVLSALQQASGEVEIFYQFSLETAWQRISDTAKSVLHYMGQADAGVTWAELSGAWGVLESDWNKTRRDLKRWYLIEDVQDTKGNQRYDLHPWVRSSVRGGLVDKWQLSLQQKEQIAKWKFDIDI